MVIRLTLAFAIMISIFPIQVFADEQNPPAMAIWQNQMNRGEEAYHRKDFAQAEPLYKRAWQMVRRYGPKDYRFAISLEHYARVLNALDKEEEALALHQDALQIRERVLGELSDATMNSLMMVALQLVDLKEFDKAETIFQRFLDAHAKRFGKTSPEYDGALELYKKYLRD